MCALLLIVAACFFKAYAQVPRTAKLTWVAPTKDVEGGDIIGPITYTVYAGVKGSAKNEVVRGLSAVTYTVAALPPGETCFEVTANTEGGESARSSEVCKTFPIPRPAAPSSVVVQ